MNRTNITQSPRPGEQDRHGVDPRPPEPDVRRTVDGVQGATAPQPHQLPLHPGMVIKE